MVTHPTEVRPSTDSGDDVPCLDPYATIVEVVNSLISAPILSASCDSALQDLLAGCESHLWLEQNRLGIATVVEAAVLTGKLDGDAALQVLEGGHVDAIQLLMDAAVGSLSEWANEAATRYIDEPMGRSLSLDIDAEQDTPQILLRSHGLFLVPVSLTDLSPAHADFVYRVITTLQGYAKAAPVEDGFLYCYWLFDEIEEIKLASATGIDLYNLSIDDAYYLTSNVEALLDYDPDADFDSLQERVSGMADNIAWKSPCLTTDEPEAFTAATLLRELWACRHSDPAFISSPWGQFSKKAVLFLRRMARQSDIADFSFSPFEDGQPLAHGTLVSFGEPWSEEVAESLHQTAMESGESFSGSLLLNDVAGHDLCARLSIIGEATGLLTLVADIKRGTHD